MILNKYSFVVFFTLLLAIACEKDPVAPIDNTPDPPVGYKQYGTPFDQVPVNDDIVMYEVNLRAFSTAGTLKGVRSRLDEIKALGVNVIWLMPIYPIGLVKGINSPYCIKDFKAVSMEYGTLPELRNLTNEAHALGMAVVLDWVANHTSWDNAWISHKDWYTQDAGGNIIHPAGTNWLDVADLNFANSEMRLTMIDAMKYWVLEANVDGFRCDYADGVPFDFWQQAIDTLNAVPNRNLVFLAEGSRADHFQAGFDLNFAWDFYGKVKDVFNGQPANELFATHVLEYSNVPAGQHKLRFTTNHDQSANENTPMVLFHGKQGALAASVATIFMGGVPLFYSGQEVGRMAKVPFFSKSPINWNENPDMLTAYKDMMAFYSSAQVARSGTGVDYSNNEVICFTKTLGDEQVLIIINTHNESVEYTVPSQFVGSYWTDALTNDTLQFGASVQLANYQYLIAQQ